jgi:hypothetical protein
LNLDSEPVHVNECVHCTVQHCDRPDRPASDPQTGEHDAEEKRPHHLREHARLSMTGEKV